jgi:hypothetical protein
MAPGKILASQARSFNLYKNLRTKVMKHCANICFNWQCINKKVVPKYANIKLPHTSPATNITSKKYRWFVCSYYCKHFGMPKSALLLNVPILIWFKMAWWRLCKSKLFATLVY